MFPKGHLFVVTRGAKGLQVSIFRIQHGFSKGMLANHWSVPANKHQTMATWPHGHSNTPRTRTPNVHSTPLTPFIPAPKRIRTNHFSGKNISKAIDIDKNSQYSVAEWCRMSGCSVCPANPVAVQVTEEMSSLPKTIKTAHALLLWCPGRGGWAEFVHKPCAHFRVPLMVESQLGLFCLKLQARAFFLPTFGPHRILHLLCSPSTFITAFGSQKCLGQMKCLALSKC